MPLPTMRFSKQHRRNSFDFKIGTDPETGRGVQTAKGGVWKRCGLIVTALANAKGGMKPREILEYMQESFHGSYAMPDIRHALKRLINVGVVRHRREPKRVYEVTDSGRAFWNKLPKEWQ